MKGGAVAVISYVVFLGCTITALLWSDDLGFTAPSEVAGTASLPAAVHEAEHFAERIPFRYVHFDAQDRPVLCFDGTLPSTDAVVEAARQVARTEGAQQLSQSCASLRLMGVATCTTGHAVLTYYGDATARHARTCLRKGGHWASLQGGVPL